MQKSCKLEFLRFHAPRFDASPPTQVTPLPHPPWPRQYPSFPIPSPISMGSRLPHAGIHEHGTYLVISCKALTLVLFCYSAVTMQRHINHVPHTWRPSMKFAFRTLRFLLACALLAHPALCAAESQPLRVVIAGLVHGHVDGFLSNSAHRPEIQIVGISDPDRSLFERYAAKFALDSALYHPSLEEMLRTTRPQAVLVYSNTFDHRKIVELCAQQHIPVMMEKPLAVSLADAQAIERAAREGKIQVLVNYETSWYRSNRAAFDLVHADTIGDIRKVVIHDGHQGPKEIGVSAEV